jgi:ornithine cyclodeaminase/alanine dehydrogenase
MLAAKAAGIDFTSRLIGLDRIISSSHPGRSTNEQIILYKSVGGAIQDIAIAGMCFRRAEAIGIGTPMPVTISPVSKGK